VTIGIRRLFCFFGGLGSINPYLFVVIGTYVKRKINIFYGLFNCATSSSDYMASSDSIINELYVLKLQFSISIFHHAVRSFTCCLFRPRWSRISLIFLEVVQAVDVLSGGILHFADVLKGIFSVWTEIFFEVFSFEFSLI
jgi:hypothetical protein